jgi:hypothetical protein
MSFLPGSLAQPDSVVTGGAFTVAPQRGQLNCAGSMAARHQGQLNSEEAATGGAAPRFTGAPQLTQKAAFA